MAYANKDFNEKNATQIKCLEGVMRDNRDFSEALNAGAEPSNGQRYINSSAKDNPVIVLCRAFKKHISNFEDGLDFEDEVGVILAGYSGNFIIHLRSIGYIQPELIVIYGIKPDGQEIQVIQNIAQFNLIMKPVRKVSEKAHRVVFLG